MHEGSALQGGRIHQVIAVSDKNLSVGFGRAALQDARIESAMQDGHDFDRVAAQAIDQGVVEAVKDGPAPAGIVAFEHVRLVGDAATEIVDFLIQPGAEAWTESVEPAGCRLQVGDRRRQEDNPKFHELRKTC